MKVFVDIAEAAERFDELIDFVLRDDEVVVCRTGDPIAAILPLSQDGQGTWDGVWALALKGRPANTHQISDRDELYDENGLQK
ncbi:prevent-host-death family protein [Ochrobactrum sp. GPK 3]|uniref:type II toxin-antitoxin system Phd/YefM family antitoxin n=1 Tax=Brucella sp. 22210 TaxID=3453892 RepID=UPI0031385429